MRIRWFAELWQGKALAITVAWTSLERELDAFLAHHPEIRPRAGVYDNRDATLNAGARRWARLKQPHRTWAVR